MQFLKNLLLSVLVILLLNPMQGITQEEFVMPQAKLLTKFEFIMLTGGTIIIKAALDESKDSLNFVLDTGSGGISLDSSTAANLKLKPAKTDKTIRGIAGIKTVDFIYKKNLHLPKLTVDSLDFHVNNYDLLTSVYGIKVDGIIGYSFFRRYIVKINYDTYTLEVYSPGTLKYPRGGYMLRPKFTTLPLVNLGVRDEAKTSQQFIFDTGAGLNMLLSEDYVADSSLLKKKRKLFPVQAEGLGGKKMMNITVVKEITVGNYKFKNVPTYIFNDEFNITSYPLLGGLIGNDILRRFNAIINYPDFTIHLKPNSHFAEPFDYTYTGLGIFSIEGKVLVMDVIDNSPAHKAGFLPGDEIFALNNNFTKNLQAYKAALQNATSHIKALIIRNGSPIELNLEVINILTHKK